MIPAIECAFEVYNCNRDGSLKYWSDWLNEKVDNYSDFGDYGLLRDHVWKIFLNDWNERLQAVIGKMVLFDNWFDWIHNYQWVVADCWTMILRILNGNWNEHLENMKEYD